MNKRGISNIIVVMLLFLIVISAFSVLYVIVSSVLKSSKEKAEDEVTCLTKVDLEIIDSCYEDSEDLYEDTINFTVKNNNNFEYDTKYFLLGVYRGDSMFNAPTNLFPSSLKGFEQKTFVSVIENPSDIEKAIFIPKTKQEKGYCYGKAIEFKPEPC